MCISCRGSNLTSESSCKANCTVRAFNFNAKRAQNIDSPTCSRGPVFLPTRHRRRYRRVDQPRRMSEAVPRMAMPYLPVTSFNIVIIPSRSDAVHDKRTDGFNCGEPTGSSCRHRERGWGQGQERLKAGKRDDKVRLDSEEG